MRAGRVLGRQNLYCLEGLFLHVPVCMVQKGSRFGEIRTSKKGMGNFSSEQQESNVNLIENVVNVLRHIICVVQ